MKLPHQYMLHEIVFILACDKKYTEAFELWVKELNDIEYSEYVCSKVYQLNKDDTIFFKLFEVFIENKLSDWAIDLLESKVDHMPYHKVLKVFKNDEILKEKHYKVFCEIFKRIEKLENQIKVHERLSNYAVLQAQTKYWEAKAEYFLVKQNMQWAYWGKKIKSPNVYYDYKHKDVYHVFCKRGVPNIDF